MSPAGWLHIPLRMSLVVTRLNFRWHWPTPLTVPKSEERLWNNLKGDGEWIKRITMAWDSVGRRDERSKGILNSKLGELREDH